MEHFAGSGRTDSAVHPAIDGDHQRDGARSAVVRNVGGRTGGTPARQAVRRPQCALRLRLSQERVPARRHQLSGGRTLHGATLASAVSLGGPSWAGRPDCTLRPHPAGPPPRARGRRSALAILAETPHDLCARSDRPSCAAGHQTLEPAAAVAGRSDRRTARQSRRLSLLRRRRHTALRRQECRYPVTRALAFFQRSPSRKGLAHLAGNPPR
ncbi:hypothetical protein LMG16407_00454 [Pandoraea apista]|nr:hypothetical protein LMG16407_00454 [Pandoraea apista]